MRKLVILLFLGIFLSLSPIKLLPLSNDIPHEIVVHAAEECGGENDALRSCNLAERIANPDGFVFQSWVVMRNIINILLILALIAISFSNITRINIDTYTLKKSLPRILIGVVLANASLFIIRYMADIATVVTYFFVEQSNFTNVAEYTFKTFLTDVTTKIGLETIINTTNFLFVGGQSIALILMLIIGLIIGIGLLWLAILLYVRLVAVYLLTILSPLVFMAYGVPGVGEKFFRQWWQQFTKWLFMLPAMAAVFWLLLLVGRTGEGSLMQVVIMFVLFFTALTIPTKWGGVAMGKVSSGFAKYTGIDAGRRAAGKAVSDYATEKGKQIGYRMPGAARFVAWREQQKDNAEKDIKKRRQRGRNKMLRGGAGRKSGRLSHELLAEENITAGLESDNLRRALTEELAKKLLISETGKTTAEKEKQHDSDNKKFNLLFDRDNDEEVKGAIDKFAKANSEADALSEAVGTSESIIIGNYTNRRLAALNNAAKYNDNIDAGARELKKVEDAEKQFGSGSPEHTAALNEYTISKADRAEAEVGLKEGFDEVKAEFTDLAHMTIEEAAEEMKTGSVTGRIWIEENKKNAIAYNKGIDAQSEGNRLDGNVVQVHSNFSNEFTKLDPETIKKLASGISAGVEGKTQRDFDLYTHTMKHYFKSNRNPNHNGAIQSALSTLIKQGKSELTFINGKDKKGKDIIEQVNSGNVEDIMAGVDGMNQRDRSNLVKAISGHAAFGGGAASHVGNIAGLDKDRSIT